MKNCIIKCLRILLSAVCGVSVFALFIWKGFWIALGWIVAALVSYSVATTVYDGLDIKEKEQ